MNAHNNMKKSFKVHKGGDDSNLGGGGVLCQEWEILVLVQIK